MIKCLLAELGRAGVTEKYFLFVMVDPEFVSGSR